MHIKVFKIYNENTISALVCVKEYHIIEKKTPDNTHYTLEVLRTTPPHTKNGLKLYDNNNNDKLKSRNYGYKRLYALYPPETRPGRE